MKTTLKVTCALIVLFLIFNILSDNSQSHNICEHTAIAQDIDGHNSHWHSFQPPLLQQSDRQKTGHIMPELCWHPETDPKVIEKLHQSNKGFASNSLYPSGDLKYQIINRWTTTATNGGGLTQGDATTLTWSFVPDGTAILQGCNVPGESTAGSDFIAFFDQQFGSGPGGNDLTQRPWFVHFQVVFDRWEELTGITYIYEPNDDGSGYGGNGSAPGVLGTRGDVRIGGHRLDGNTSVLACNYFPNSGDMIIDTDDNFYNSGNILAVRNTISHEHGHGLGFAHSCPVNQTKLMEPFVSIAFDGPQEDDILAGNRQYGDSNGNNNSSGTALALGTVTSTNSLSETMVSIDDATESDFYSFSTTSSDDYTISIIPTGTTYLAGAQTSNGNCEPGSNFNALAESDLGLELLDTDGITVLSTSNSEPAGFNEVICNSTLDAGTYFVRVFGSASTVQMYDIEIEQGTTTCASCDLIINEVDYDQGVIDNAEFIELYNPCGQVVDLNTYSIQLIDGENGTAYQTINLSGMLASGAYYVVCTNSSNTANCDLDVASDIDFIQDGAPDAIALFDGTVMTDALSYEGNVNGFTEGSATGLIDDGTIPLFGLSRIPNGTDTDNNDADYVLCLSSPGATNIDIGIPLLNPTNCQLNMSFPDVSCNSSNEFPILVTGVDATQLGSDVELKNVDVIIEHTWVNDIDMSLIAPSGTSIILSTDNGGDGDNYGDPTDVNCQSVTSFDMTASTSITSGTAPFIGSFIPEGDFASFDGVNPNGVWILQICDDIGGDVGELEFARLEFEVLNNNPCPPSYSADNGNMLTGTQSMVADFETDGVIESNQIIDADVTYDSGTSIELVEGFEVFVGRVFEAFIDGCGNLIQDNNEIPKKE
jgi:subtilisin-like proprotein convertase family protein